MSSLLSLEDKMKNYFRDLRFFRAEAVLRSAEVSGVSRFSAASIAVSADVAAV